MTLIAHITDPHLRAQGIPAYRVVETNMLAERAIAAVNALDPQPDFTIVTGDLVDKGLPEEYAVGRQILDQLKTPYAVVAGNHDLSAELKTCFSDRDWASQMPGDSVQFSIQVADIRIIGLNTAVAGKPYGHLNEEELAWLAETLADDTQTPTLIAMHHPPILTGLQSMDRSKLRNSEDLKKLLSEYSNVHRILCGHDHRPVFAPFGNTHVSIGPGMAHQVVLDLRPDQPQRFNFEPPAFLLHKYGAETGLVTNMAYVEQFPGPYPFWSDTSTEWP